MFCVNCKQAIIDSASFCHHCGHGVAIQEKNTDIVAGTILGQSTSVSLPQAEREKRKDKNKKIGLCFLIIPFVVLSIVILLYALVGAISQQSVAAGVERDITMGIWHYLLALFGILSVVGIIFGVPLGVIFLMKTEECFNCQFDSRSGRGSVSEIPAEINHWNWGAAGLTWIWGAAHKVWIAFLTFIPVVNIFMWIYLGFEGNKLAWRADKWESVEKFLQTERKWKPWGIAIFILNVLGLLAQLSGLGK